MKVKDVPFKSLLFNLRKTGDPVSEAWANWTTKAKHDMIDSKVNSGSIHDEAGGPHNAKYI